MKNYTVIVLNFMIGWMALVGLPMKIYAQHTASSKYNVEGFWTNSTADLIIQIKVDKNKKLEGKIVWLADSIDAIGNERRDVRNSNVNYRSRTLKGTPIVYGYEHHEKDNTWINGQIYNYKNGVTYHGKLWVNEEDILFLKGYWEWFWFLSKTQQFKRVLHKEHLPHYTKEN